MRRWLARAKAACVRATCCFACRHENRRARWLFRGAAAGVARRPPARLQVFFLARSFAHVPRTSQVGSLLSSQPARLPTRHPQAYLDRLRPCLRWQEKVGPAVLAQVIWTPPDATIESIYARYDTLPRRRYATMPYDAARAYAL